MVGEKMFKRFIESIISITSIYEFRKLSWGKVMLHFLILTVIISFPLNIRVIRNKGLRVDKESSQILSMMTKDFREQLPNDCSITLLGLACHVSQNVHIDAGDITLIINADPSFQAPPYSLVFYRDKIVFMKEKLVKESSYIDYKEPVVFGDIKSKSINVVKERLLSGFEDSFEAIDILEGILFVTGSYLLMNLLYLVIASGLAMLLKFGHARFITYREIVKIFIFSSTIPTLFGFIIGFAFQIEPFIPVIYQFGTPIIFLVVYYRQIVPDLTAN